MIKTVEIKRYFCNICGIAEDKKNILAILPIKLGSEFRIVESNHPDFDESNNIHICKPCNIYMGRTYNA